MMIADSISALRRAVGFSNVHAAPLLACFALLAGSICFAENRQGNQRRNQSGSQTSSSKQHPGKAGSSGASETSSTQPVYDPLHAEEDVNVGTFYMHKGDLDAAIARFRHSLTLKPNFAKPRLLLGECYEKKDDNAQALRYYRQYLAILPHGPDAKRVRERVARLSAALKSPSK
jgi:tetratricopeptide (TPR) repeat protein